MSALPKEAPLLRPMDIDAIAAIVPIEKAAYEFPWSRGNFIDSLAAGYLMYSLLGNDGETLAYFVAMTGVDEMHLLNITVAPMHQRQGHARRMLDALVALARERLARQLWLEVRASNHRATNIYLRYGFRHIGVRRGYYPAPHGQREDARVMSLDLAGAVRALD